MVDRKYTMDVYKSVKIGIATGIKNSEMLQFFPDYLRTEKICKHAVKKIPS